MESRFVEVLKQELIRNAGARIGYDVWGAWAPSMASAEARAYNGDLGAEPPAGVQGAQPPVWGQGAKKKLTVF